ncbi:MAG: hypothetical protein H7X92_02675, partial [Chitinophagales bacterium]|nr:hypothetical protein [Hyphomicrobiales bacterium]
MKNTARALMLCALYFCVAPAYAQADLKAKDAVDFYLSYCVKTVGSKTTAVTVLGEGNALSKKLSEETVEKMQRMKGGV